jgi:hypothetical protein
MLHEVGRGLAPDFYYRSAEAEPYLRALENSFLLHSFAHRHQAELIAQTEEGILDDIWIEQLADFVYEELDYPSDLTRRADALVKATATDSCPAEARATAGKLLDAARGHDRRRPLKFRSYLARRLWQLAVERAFSTYRAYDQVVVNHDPAVALAARQIVDR